MTTSLSLAGRPMREPWMRCPQVLWHIDATWQLRTGKVVYRLMIVEKRPHNAPPRRDAYEAAAIARPRSGVADFRPASLDFGSMAEYDHHGSGTDSEFGAAPSRYAA